MTIYLPPPFDLYEFPEPDVDDSSVTKLPSRRWFSHWNGRVEEPAVEVILGWSRGFRSALVCASVDDYSNRDARFRAFHLALGGDELAIPNRPTSARETIRAIEDGADSAMWHHRASGEKGSVTCEAILDDYSVGYCRIGEVTVFVAAIGVESLVVQRVHGWDDYPVDASRPFDMNDALH